MKYKYPKKIVIGDTVFKIIYDYNCDEGASFNYPTNGKKAFVKFGMKNHKINSREFLHFIIHEFKEIIQIEQSTRMHNRGADIFEFHYKHQEHSDLCCRLSEILTRFIK